MLMESYLVYVEIDTFLLYIGKVEVWKIFLYYLSICFGLTYDWVSVQWQSAEASAPTDVVLVLGRLIYYTTAAFLLILQICSCRFTIINFTKWLLIKLGFLSPVDRVWSAREISEYIVCGLLAFLIGYNIRMNPTPLNFFTIIISYIDMRIIQAMLRHQEPFEIEFMNNV